jgi:dihydroxyacetone kinase-like predicted kinase|tara:strand:- start:1285 stop:1467 length:183 start_codon:yes stop_codon:yes gene_type:complete
MGKVKQMAFDQEEKYIQKTIEEGGDSQQEILNNVYKRDIQFHSQDQIEDIIFDYFQENKP